MAKWTTEEINMLGSNTDAAIGQKIGRKPHAVETMRQKRGIAPFIRHSREWKPAEIKLLGTMADAALARRLGCSYQTVRRKRVSLKIPPLWAKFSNPGKTRPAKMVSAKKRRRFGQQGALAKIRAWKNSRQRKAGWRRSGRR